MTLWQSSVHRDALRAPHTPRATKGGVVSAPVSPMSGVIKAVEVIRLVSPSPAPLAKRLVHRISTP